MNPMVITIIRSSICLNPVWGAAVEIARLADKLPAWVPRRSVVPGTVDPAVLAAYRRASEVLAFNARRG